MISGQSLLNTQHQAFLGCLEQKFQIFRNLANRHRNRRISVIVAVTDPVIDAENVPFSQNSPGRNPVDNLFVDRRAKCRWEAMIAFESWTTSILTSHVF